MSPIRTASILFASLVIVGGTTVVRAHADPAEPASGDPPVRVVADLSARRLSILQGDQVLESYPVAVGKGSKPTPTGDYTIRKIVWNPAWIPPDSKWAQ
ncbi:MAG: L,D-transpeptidase, partial [Deltaproteobacteria bacterium]